MAKSTHVYNNQCLLIILLCCLLWIVLFYFSMIHSLHYHTSRDMSIQTQTVFITPPHFADAFLNQTLIARHTSTAITSPPSPHDNNHAYDSDLAEFYVQQSIGNASYETNDFSFVWNMGDGSPIFMNASQHDTARIGFTSFVFCPVPKVGCSQWKQILRRIKGETYYLADDFWSLHSNVNQLEYDRIHRMNVTQANQVLHDPNVVHAVFVRDSIERALSAFLDKCIGGHWRKYWCTPRTNPNNQITHKIYSHFDLFVDALINPPPTVGIDSHWMPQHFVCDLYKFIGRYRVYHAEDVQSRYQFLMDIGGQATWDAIGAHGWINHEHPFHDNDELRDEKELAPPPYIVDENNKSHVIQIRGRNAAQQMLDLNLNGTLTQTRSHHSVDTAHKVLQYYRADLVAKMVAFYESDYQIFRRRLPEWICRFVQVEPLVQALLKSAEKHVQTFDDLQILKYGQFSTFAMDYDHSAVVNASGEIWSRAQELLDRKNRHNAQITDFYEMMRFDADPATQHSMIHYVRGIAALCNVLTFVDYKILPHSKCNIAATQHKTLSWDWTLFAREMENIVARLIDAYFNQYWMVHHGNVSIPTQFVVLGNDDRRVKVAATFAQWRQSDTVFFHNIRTNMLYLRDIPRNIFANYAL